MSKKSWKASLLALAVVMLFAALPVSSVPEGSAAVEGFRGYCSCGCSFVKDCNTDADCGSGRCLKGPTCC